MIEHKHTRRSLFSLSVARDIHAIQVANAQSILSKDSSGRIVSMDFQHVALTKSMYEGMRNELGQEGYKVAKLIAPFVLAVDRAWDWMERKGIIDTWQYWH